MQLPNPEGSSPEIQNSFAAQAKPEALTPMSPTLEVAQQIDNLIPADALQVLDKLPEPSSSAQSYIMGEAAGGPPPTNLGIETAPPAPAGPASPEAPPAPVTAPAAEQRPGGLPADHPDAPAPGFGPGGPTNREVAASSAGPTATPFETPKVVVPSTIIETGKTADDIFNEYSRGDYTRDQIEGIQDPALREQLLKRIDATEKAPDAAAILAQEQAKAADQAVESKAIALGADVPSVKHLIDSGRNGTLDPELWQSATPQEREAAFDSLTPEQQALFPKGELGGIEVKPSTPDVAPLTTEQLLAADPFNAPLDELETSVDALYKKLDEGTLSDEQIDALSEFDDVLQMRKEDLERSQFRVPTPDGMKDGETLAQFKERTDAEAKGAALDAEFATQQSRLDAMRSSDPELKARYKAYNERQEDKRQRTRFEDPRYRPTDAREGETYDQYVEREAKIKQFLNPDASQPPLEQADIDLIQPDIDRLTDIREALSNGTPIDRLSPRDRSLANKYDIKAEAKISSAERRQARLRELESEIQKNNPDPEIQKEYTRLREEQTNEDTSVKRRDELRDMLLKDGKLPAELASEYDRLNKELKDREMTPEERTQRMDQLTDKMLRDWVYGEGWKPEDAEEFAKLKGQEMGDASSRREGAKAIMEKMIANRKEGKGKLSEKRETQVERQTKEKLAKLMGLEMQMQGIPQQLEALADAQDKIRKDIKAKKSEIDGFSTDQDQTRKRTELYPLMVSLSRNKGLISHYSNHARVLKAEYKTTMADLNRTLKLNGRFGLGIIPDVLQHASARFSRIMADLKTDYDSIYASDSSDARRISRTTA